MRAPTMWNHEQQIESSLKQLKKQLARLKAMKTPAPPGVVADIELAVHHLGNALYEFKVARAKRQKLAEEYRERLRTVDNPG